MDRALYIAMSGAKQAMRSQVVNTNNLANANTIGFKKDFNYFTDVQVKGDVFKSRAYSVAKGSSSDYGSGQMIPTGRNLDISIQGSGYIAVQSNDGREAFTRSGGLRITPNGILTNGAGYPVLGNDGGPVAIPPYDKLEIGEDGTVSIVPVGQEKSTMAIVDRIKLVNPNEETLGKGDDGLFYTNADVVSEPDANVRVISGFLESSNVNGVTEMVNMITNARHFEAQIKVMSTVKENDTASAKLLRIS